MKINKLFNSVKVAAIASFLIIVTTYKGFSELVKENDKLLDESGWVDSVGFRQQKLKISNSIYLSFSLDGKRFFTFSNDLKLRTWDTQTGSLIKVDSFPSYGNDIEFTGFDLNLNDEKTVAISTTNKYHGNWNKFYVYVYDISVDTLICRIDPLISVQIDQSEFEYYYSNRSIFNLKENYLTNFINVKKSYPHASIDCGYAGNWNPFTGEYLGTKIGNVYNGSNLGNTNFIYNMVYSKDFKYLFTSSRYSVENDNQGNPESSSNSQLILYNFALDSSYILFNIQNNKYAIETYDLLDISNDNQKLVGHFPADTGKEMSVWNTETKIKLFDWSLKNTLGFHFSNNNNFLISEDYQTDSKNINLKTNCRMNFRELTYGEIIDSILFPKIDYAGNFITEPDSNAILVFGADGYLRLFDISKQNLTLKALFSADSTSRHPGETVKFTDYSIGDPYSYLWYFGDGNSINTQNPTHIYSKTGNYTVKLIVSIGGQSDTLIKKDYIKVRLPMNAGFTVDTVAGNLPFSAKFTDKTTGQPESWYWDFGDGDTSTARNPIHIYKKLGLFTVKLIVSDGAYSDTIIKTKFIQTYQGFKLAFDAEPKIGPLPLNVKFTNLTNIGLNYIYWDFGDGSVSYDYSPTHTYLKKGFFTVKLIGSDNYTTDSVISKNLINVRLPYILNFSADSFSGNAPLTVHFTNLTGKDIQSWLWDFGDGETSTEKNPVHIYHRKGTFTVKLFGDDGYYKDSIIHTDFIIVIKNFNLDFSVDTLSGDPPLTVHFYGFSGIPLKSWFWDFGNGETSTEQNPVHTFYFNGSYTVTLIGADGYDTETLKKEYYIQVNFLSLTGVNKIFETVEISGNQNLFPYNGISGLDGKYYVLAETGANPDQSNIYCNEYTNIWPIHYQSGIKLIQLRDSNFVLMGADPVNHSDLYYYIINGQGTIVLEKGFGNGNNIIPHDIHCLTNDSYIIDGTYTENSESYKILVKYDSSGQLLWNFQKNSIAPYLIAATRDGGFASVDFINNNLIKLEKYDSLNNVTELNEMILNYPFKANDIIQTSDNGYLITGVSLIDSMKNGVIYKINNLGLILKKIDAIDSNTNYKDIHQVNDNLYVINTQFNRHPGYILINSSGEILQKVPLKERYNEFSSVSVAYDSILFFTGQYHDGNCCIGIYWFGLSIDSHFLSVPEIPSQAETFSLHAFPNPFSNSITIEFFLPEPSPVKVSLYDIFGNEVDVIARNDYQQGLQRVEYSGSRLSQGMYYLRVQAGTMTATERIVLVK